MAYVVFLIINLMYISFEFLFNFSLLNTVGSSSSTIDDIHKIENIGRFLAASGFTLLCWKFINAKGYNKRWKYKKLSWIMVTLISFFGFYNGQEKYIDYLARSFEPETKQKIHDMYLLKQGLLTGSVVLQNVPYNINQANNPESKTFIAGIALFMINNDKTLDYIRKNSEPIARHIYVNELKDSPEKFYHVYKPLIEKVDAVFSDYFKINNKRKDDAKQAKKIADNSFPKMHKQLKYKYKYSRSRLSYTSYVNTREIKDLIKSKIRSEYRLTVTRDFNPMDRNSYSRALIGSVTDIYDTEYQNTVKNNEFGIDIPLGIDYREEFYQHPQIVSLFKKTLGPFYFNDKELGGYAFRDLDPALDKKLILYNANTIGNALAIDHNKVDLNSEGVTDIIKAMIVPPIALILSMFFGFMNLFLIVKNISFKIFEKLNKSPKKNANIVMYSLIFSLLMFPLILSNSYTETKAYQGIYKNMSKHSFLIAFSANWILKFEPFVYNYGKLILPNKNKL